MNFHIVLPRHLKTDEISAIDIGGDRPRVGIAMLARELNATLHAPSDQPTSRMDLLRAKIAGPTAMWSLARELAAQVSANDVIFCGTEASGLQIAEACGGMTSKPTLCMFVHNLDRPRGRAALKLFRVGKRVDLMLACSSLQTQFLQRYLRASDSQVQFIWDHTDTSFFTPGPPSPDKKRPLIVSVGLEQRDYRTLAAATGDMDLDVRISGFSVDAAVSDRAFPPVMPENMNRQFYSWVDLRRLYRDADLVVVSVHDNKYAAGVQSLMEAMACGRPVVATASAGLANYLDSEAVVTVPPGDVMAMREAIRTSLTDPLAAQSRAQRGLRLARARHGIERYVSEIAGHLRAF